MVLKAVHDSQEEIPENYRDLYTEKDGKWELTGIQGVKTTADTSRLEESLKKERKKVSAYRDKLKLFNGGGELSVDAEIDDWRARASDHQSKFDRIEELEAAAGDKLDDSKINEMVEKRVNATLNSKLAPVQRELETVKREREEFAAANEGYAKEKRRRTIHDAVREALMAEKVVQTAFDDALMLAERHFEVTDEGQVVTREDAGVMVGLDPKGWLAELQPKREHWWPNSVGGGSRGSGTAGTAGNNPFSAKHWNMTEQGKVLRESPERAKQLAEAAGTKIGGPKPKA